MKPNFFKKRKIEEPKTQEQENKICDQNAVDSVVEIPFYAPNQSLKPIDYRISPQMDELETRFRELCDEFLGKANPDAYNSTYMDALIERTCLDCINYLWLQRNDHVSLIKTVLNDLHGGDLIKCQEKLAGFIRDKERNEKELEMYRRVLQKGTCFEEEA